MVVFRLVAGQKSGRFIRGLAATNKGGAFHYGDNVTTFYTHWQGLGKTEITMLVAEDEFFLAKSKVFLIFDKELGRTDHANRIRDSMLDFMQAIRWAAKHKREMKRYVLCRTW